MGKIVGHPGSSCEFYVSPKYTIDYKDCANLAPLGDTKVEFSGPQLQFISLDCGPHASVFCVDEETKEEPPIFNVPPILKPHIQ